MNRVARSSQADKDDALAERMRLSRQQHKDHLRDFLRLMRITDLAQGGAIDQADVAFGQRGEGRFRATPAIVGQQFKVILLRHLTVYVRGKQKQTFIWPALPCGYNGTNTAGRSRRGGRNGRG